MNEPPAITRRARWLLGLTALLVLVASTAATYHWFFSTSSVPEIPLEGQDKEVADAIKDAREKLAKAPRSAQAWGFLGRVLLTNEVFPDIALTCFQEAERLDPDEPRWPYFAGVLLAAYQEKPEKALPKLERAVDLAERDRNGPSAPRLRLAETLVSLGQVEQATGQFKKVMTVEPNNPRAHFGLGLLAYSRGDWPMCRLYLEACRGVPQARKKAYIHLATVCERLGDKENAETYAKLAASVPKDFDWSDLYIQENLRLAVRKRDRIRAAESFEADLHFEDAANYVRILIAEYPDDDGPHLMMGRLQGQIGNFHSAELHLLKARQMAPDKNQVHYLLSLVLLKKGEALLTSNGDPLKAKALFEESAQSARRALAILPDYGYAHMSLGLALKHLGKRADSLAELRQAVHCNPEYADNHLFLGQALADEGDVAAARYHLEQARLLAHPKDPRPKAALDKLPAKNAPKLK